jgi:uncharacterized protein YhjY with autotransporter beta-barrel domain
LFSSTDANVDAFGDAIVTGFGAGDFDDQTFALLGALNEEGFTNAAESLLPDLSNNAPVQVFEAVSNVGDIINRRIGNASRRSGSAFNFDAGTQLASAADDVVRPANAADGYYNVQTGFWINGTYRVADQDNTNNTGGPSNGYESDILSVASGFDFAVSDSTLLGLSVAYSNIDTDLDRASGGESELDAYHFSVYAAHRAGPVFLSGQAGYTTSDIEAVRLTNLGAGTIRSDFDVDGFSAQLNASYDISLGGNGYFAPLVGLNYSRFSTDDYVEDGGLDLLIDVESTDFVEARGGFLLGYEAKTDNGSFINLFGKVAYVVNLSDNATNVTARFGTQTVVLQGIETNDERVELGAGVNFYGDNNLTIGASVDGEVSSDYSSIGGTFRVKFAF